jgi:hypothetical protein
VAERSAITQSVQIGVETTPGTAVAANKRLGSMGFGLAQQTENTILRPIGQKYPTLSILGKEWVEADVEGSPTYTELPYALASCINSPSAVTQILDGATPTTAYRWTFTSNTFGDDTPKTFTIEQGSAFRAHRIVNGIFSEYTWDWGRDEIELGGTVLGRAIEDGITLTGSPTGLSQIPVRPGDLSVYLDTTSGAIGTTKLTRVLGGEINIEDRFNPLWVVDAAQPSFVNVVEGEPNVEFVMTQMADGAAMANLTRMRVGTTAFLRLRGVGPNIYTGTGGTPLIVNHQVTFDIAGQVSEMGDFSDEDGVFAVEFTFKAVHDATWGKAFTAEVITTTTAL